MIVHYDAVVGGGKGGRGGGVVKPRALKFRRHGLTKYSITYIALIFNSQATFIFFYLTSFDRAKPF